MTARTKLAARRETLSREFHPTAGEYTSSCAAHVLHAFKRALSARGSYMCIMDAGPRAFSRGRRDAYVPYNGRLPLHGRALSLSLSLLKSSRGAYTPACMYVGAIARARWCFISARGARLVVFSDRERGCCLLIFPGEIERDFLNLSLVIFDI